MKSRLFMNLLLGSLFFALPCMADTIVFKNFSQLKGEVVQREEGRFRLELERSHSRVWLDQKHIEALIEEPMLSPSVALIQKDQPEEQLSPEEKQNQTYDIIHLKSGVTKEGIILEEAEDSLIFQVLIGDKKSTIGLPLQLIERVERISLQARENLLDEQEWEDNWEQRERLSMAQYPVELIPWGPEEHGWQVQSDHYVIQTNTTAFFAQQIAHRMEQILHAYMKYFSFQDEAQPKTYIIVFKSQEEYDRFSQAFFPPGVNSRGYYLKGGNLLVTWSSREKALADYKDFLCHWNQLDMNKMSRERLRETLSLVKESKQAVTTMEKETFETLYHEGFHDFMVKRYPPPSPMPIWLEEGLAERFELSEITSEQGLVISRVHREYIALLQEFMKRGDLIPLRDLLTSSHENFKAFSDSSKNLVSLYYAESWTLVHYLCQMYPDRVNLVFEQYLKLIQDGVDRVEAFEKLVNMRIDTFEKQWVDYIMRYRI